MDREQFLDLACGPTLAAMTAGALEIMAWHPFDTAAKRLMSHEQKVLGGSIAESMSKLHTVLFKGRESASMLKKMQHLYPGLKFAFYYKVSQRIIKFAGQPYMKDFLHRRYAGAFTSCFGQRRGKMMLEATAGTIMGIGETILLPIDRIKVLSQTNRGAIGSRSGIKILFQEGPLKMYAGFGTTAIRNCIGSFLLFGGTAVTKEHLFHIEDYRKATFAQNVVSSSVGACLGVFCTSPIDVIKTRIQNKNFDVKVSGFRILVDVLRKEGPHAFFKGITPKVITVSPRLVFTFTVTEAISKKLRKVRQTLK